MSLLKIFDLKSIAILVLLGVLGFQFFFSTSDSDSDKDTIDVDGIEYELLSQSTDTVYQERKITDTVHVPKYVEKVDTVRIKEDIDVDTSKIINDYFSTYKYIDTLDINYEFEENIKDTSGNKPSSNLGYAVVSDSVRKNRIISRSVTWNLNIPTIRETKVVKELPKNEFYWGIDTGLNKRNLIGNIGGSVLWKRKNERIFQLGAGLQNNINGEEVIPFVKLGFYW